MTILDANLLVYAYNEQSSHHKAAAKWLADTLNGVDLIGIPWITFWAFLRVSTNRRIWPNPASVPSVFSVINQLISHPTVVIPQPGPRHAELLEKLAVDHQVAGPGTTDAVLAALAIENGAILASTDQDFRRYPSLRWVNPLAETDK